MSHRRPKDQRVGIGKKYPNAPDCKRCKYRATLNAGGICTTCLNREEKEKSPRNGRRTNGR